MANLPAKTPGLFDLRVAPAPRTRLLVGFGALAVVFALWFIATFGNIPEQRWISPVILPSPIEVAKSFGPLWTERDLLASIIATLRRVLAGFGLAIVVGVPIGIVAGSWRVLEAAAMPVASKPPPAGPP